MGRWCAWILLLPSLALAEERPSGIAAFFARHCLECHNASDRKGNLDLSGSATALTGGDSGPAFVAGQPDESLIWERVDAGEMPPKEPLAAADKAFLKEWLAAGAKYDRDPIDRFEFSTGSRAGYDWWSLQPVNRAQPPASDRAGWNTPIDRFVLARLKEAGLEPSPQADKRTLIRRVTFDLTGLPPTPDEIAAFLADESPDAWAKLVDRLLASPHYGERWGRHWLDIVRFGESQGFERDKLRGNAWQYRDWVITALNRDLPYDEFVRLQIAGDVLAPHDPLAVIATGFLVCAPYDEVGQKQQSAAMRAVVRQDELEDVIGVTSQTFLGMTVNCARCHDHKFDPIRQTEYYGLAASLAGVWHGDRDSLSQLGQLKVTRHREELQKAESALTDQMAVIDAPVRERVLAARANGSAPRELPRPIARWEFDGDLKDSFGALHGKPHAHARVENGRLVLDGESHVQTEPLKRPLTAKSLEAWVLPTKLDQQGGGVFSLEAKNGGVFDAIVYSEKDAGQWMAGSEGFQRTTSFQGPPEQSAFSEPVQIVLVYGEDRTITAYRNGQLYGKPYTANGLTTFEPGKSHVLFGLRHNPPGGNRFFTGEIDKAALYDRALTASEVAVLAGVVDTHVSDDAILAGLNPADRVKWRELAFRRSQVRMELRLLAGGSVYAVSPKPPEVTHVLARGDTRLKGDVAKPAALQSVPGVPDIDVPIDADDGTRRLRLAEWIADPRNPLTARVIVNRLWHYHFGQGFVDTPNDFGFNGGRPTHPELLNWLADELVRPQQRVAGTVEDQEPPRAWSLKHLHRLIVTSAAYRQASRGRPEAERMDAGNQLLWRRMPQRLEAEAVRDAILAVSGELNPAMGGPGFRDFRTFTHNSQFYEMFDPVGSEFHRRTIYRTWVRSGRSEFLDVFDCPDPSATAPKRAVTTTPLQALSLLNNSFVLRMSERFADRVRREAGETLEAQIARIASLAYGRPPGADEQALARDFVQAHGLTAYCRVIFNSNEFLYVD